MPRIAKSKPTIIDIEEEPQIPARPSNNFFNTKVLVIFLIIASYFLGVLTTKVSYLEKANNANAKVSGATTESTTQAPNQPKTITNDTIKQWAKELGLDTNKFNNCLDLEKYKAQVDKDTTDGQTAGVSGTPTFFVNGIKVVGAQPFESFKTVIDQQLAVSSSFLFARQAYAQEAGQKVSVDNGHLPALGDKKAKVTIVEFSDFECPFCNRFFKDTLPQIKKDYVDTGKTVLYYRHFPLGFHPLAKPFAIASECANEQGKFWEFHDKIFEEQ